MKFFNKKKNLQNEEVKKKKEDKNKEKGEKKSLKERILDKPVKLKTDTGIKVLRFIIWAFIILIFIRGIGTIIKADPVKEIKKEQDEFLVQLSERNLLESRAFSFAESFAREYFTIYIDGKDDYIKRLSKYMQNSVAETVDATGYMIPDEVRAYNIEKYSDNQVDVFVHGIVQIKTEKPGQEGITDKNQKQYDTTLKDVYIKVPIFVDKLGNMIVEDLPLLIGEPTLPEYKRVDNTLGASSADYNIQEDIKGSINQFLKAYYEEEQTQVDYFLIKPGSIKAVGGNSTFKEIESIKVYDLGSNKYQAILVYKVNNSGKELRQKININLEYKDDKYLISEMNTRTTNLKEN